MLIHTVGHDKQRHKYEYYCKNSPVDKSIFYTIFSFKAEDYREGTLTNK